MFNNITLIALGLALTACGGGGGGSSSPAPATTSVAQPSTQVTVPPSQNPDVEITVLGLVSPGVAALFPDVDLRIQHLVNVSNDVLADNNVDLIFTLDHLEVVDYPDEHDAVQSLEDLTSANHTAFSNIPQLRDNEQADIVVFFRPYANDGHCGYAWIGGYNQNGDFSSPAEADYAYSVVSANCGDYTLIHELGHNLGLAHSRPEDPAGGTFDWAVGHGVQNDFTTIMASPTEFNAAQLPRLSSPNLSCNGQPCGIEHTNHADGADAVRSLNLVKAQVAAYR